MYSSSIVHIRQWKSDIIIYWGIAKDGVVTEHVLSSWPEYTSIVFFRNIDVLNLYYCAVKIHYWHNFCMNHNIISFTYITERLLIC